MENLIHLLPLIETDVVDSGGYPKWLRTGEWKNYLPLWLKSAGYNTACMFYRDLIRYDDLAD